MKTNIYIIVLSVILSFLIITSLDSCSKGEENTNQPPTCTITSPTSGQEFTKGETVTITVDATDNDGSITEVRFFIDNVGTGSISSFPFNYNWNTDNENLGNHTLKATSIDNSGESASDEITIEITEGGGNNTPPNQPSSPNPQNNSLDQSTILTLSWTCTDPDQDPLTFDVYFGTSSNPPLIQTNILNANFNPGVLDHNTTYYWKIIVKDNHEHSTESPTWFFNTESESYDWELIDCNTDESLRKIVFINDAGWIGGHGGVILHTTNNDNWQLQNSNTTDIIRDIVFLSPTKGIAATWSWNEMLYTNDGGNTWEIRTHNLDLAMDGLYFTDELNGWGLGMFQYNSDVRHKVVKTDDGGESWEIIYDFGNNIQADDMFFINNDIGWIGSTGKVYKTTDGGYSWTSIPVSAGSVRSIYFIDEYTGWISGYPGVILHTSDGGLNWEVQKSSQGALNSIYFINSNNGWAAGGTQGESLIFKTDNGGINWNEQNVESSELLLGIYMFNTNHGYAVGANGTILKIN